MGRLIDKLKRAKINIIALEQGKKAITGAVIGLVIVLTSVVVIHTFFTFFVDKKVCESKLGKGGLWTVECKGVVEQVK